MAENKVEFGISQLHVGTYEVDNDGVVTMGTPYHQKGAVSFSPEDQSELTTFDADNIAYWEDYSASKMDGDLTVAKFDDDFKVNFLGYKRTAQGGLAKVKNAVKPNVYAAFQVEGDKESRRIIMYNGVLGSIKREYKTLEDGKRVPDTESAPMTFAGDNGDGILMATYKPDDAGYDDLFTNPPAPELESE